MRENKTVKGETDKKLSDYKEIIELSAKDLWQGNGANIGMLNETLVSVSNIILCIAEQLDDDDKLTTINYVKDALAGFEEACNNRDDYLLADNLYYVWRELVIIYGEMLGEE